LKFSYKNVSSVTITTITVLLWQVLC